MKKPKLIDKKAKKKNDKQCYFCGESDYCKLQCHRIQEGKDEGRYVDFNVITVCANCHLRIHDNQIKIDRKYFCTNGLYLLHYWDDGVEFWM